MPAAEIVTGALPELEDALAEAVADARRRDTLGPVTVLVGHVLQRPYLARALAARGVAQLNVRYVRAHELAAQLAQGDPSLRLRPKLTADAERLLAHEISTQARGPFAAITGREGFADALLRLFRELDLGGFTPEGFARAAEEAGRPDVDAAKLRELARLFGWYVERRRPLAAPADHFAAAEIASFEGPLFVYGVWRPAELAARLVERIAGVAPVTAFLPASDTDADDAHAAFRARLLAAGATARRLESRDDAAPSRVARALFGERAAAVEADGAVSLASAPDTVREVWEAARACLRWAEEGIGFHEMAVVYRNREPYRALVDEIFAEAQIPAYIHDGRLLAEHPLGRRLLALLDLAADAAFPRAKVMEFLTETRLPREPRDAYERVRPSQWEMYTREAGVVEGIEQWRARLARLAGELRERAAADEERAWEAKAAERVEELRRFATDYHAALAAHPDEATWEEHLAYLRGLAARYADDTAPIIEALDDLRALGDVLARPAFDAFCRAVRDDLESRDTSLVLGEPERMFGRQGVAVLDATSLRHLRFRAVRMLGAAERSWPPPARPDPLLLEHERRAINDAAGDATLPLRTEPDDEPLTFWLGVQAARERLVVSYARAEAGGGGKHLPSYFFRAVAETLEGRRIEHDRLDFAACVRRFAAGRLASDTPGEALSRAEYDRGLVRATLEGDGAAGVAAIERLAPPFARAIVARHERWGRALTAYDGVMTSEETIALAAERAGFADGAAVSASRLEMYAECPYRFFLRYRLRLEPAEEPEAIDRIDPLERGTLVHAILERFLREIDRDDPPRSAGRSEHLARLLAIAREEGEERERRGVTGRPLIWAMDRRQIDEDLVRWYDVEVQEAERTGFLPGAFEAGFGPLAAGPGAGDATISREAPLLLRAGSRELAFQGRIDRIDWDEARSRFRVIDYKTGKARDKAPFDRGRALQLPIYLRAAAELLGMSPEQGEAQYFYVTSRGNFRRRSVTGDELRDRAADFEQVLGTIADGIAGGMFAPNPGNGKANCMWCDYQDVCDVRIDTIAQRKAGDARAAAYRALEDIE